MDEQRRCAVAKELVKDTDRWHCGHGAKQTTPERDRDGVWWVGEGEGGKGRGGNILVRQ